MRTKTFLITFFSLFIWGESLNAQLLERLGKSAERAAKRAVERRVERETEKKANEALDKVFENERKKGEKSKNNGLYSNSNFDFIPGEKIIFFDDFNSVKTGDFPTKWNTNSSGEIVTLYDKPGKWLRIPDNTIIFPKIKSKLPQNFTIEFDLVYPVSGQRPPITFGFTDASNPAKNSLQYKKLFYFNVPSSVEQSIGYSTSIYSGRETSTEWPVDNRVDEIIRVSIAVNYSRIRLYMDNQKIIDLPNGFEQSSYRNNFHFRASPLIPKPKDAFYITNLRIAEIRQDATY